MNSLARRFVVALAVSVPVALGLLMWKAASRRPTIRVVSDSAVVALAWKEDGRSLRVATTKGKLLSLSASRLDVEREVKLRQDFGLAQFSDGGDLLFIERTNQWSLLDFKSGQKLWQNSSIGSEGTTKRRPVNSGALSPRGDAFVVSEFHNGNGFRIVLRNISNGHVVKSKFLWPLVEDSSFYLFGFSPDGKRLACMNGRGTLCLIERTSGITLWVKWLQNKEGVLLSNQPFIFAPDGSFLLALHGEKLLRIDTRTSEQTPMQGPNIDENTRFAFSPDGKTFAVGAPTGFVELRRFPSGALISAKIPFVGAVPSIAFSPDGTKLAFGTSRGVVQIWPVD